MTSPLRRIHPEILIVDEALSVGDQYFQKKCSDHIWKMKEAGKTIIFCSHDMKAVSDWCQHAVLLNGGEIVKQGPVDEVVPIFQNLMMHHELVSTKRFTEPQSA